MTKTISGISPAPSPDTPETVLADVRETSLLQAEPVGDRNTTVSFKYLLYFVEAKVQLELHMVLDKRLDGFSAGIIILTLVLRRTLH